LPLNVIGLAAIAVYAAVNIIGLWSLRNIDPGVIEEAEAHRVD